MTSPETNSVDAERQMLVDSQQRGTFATLRAYSKLSGPGWLQSAITLGGGSLAGSLYLGALAGYEMLWVQPFFMILGIVMLGATAYVTLSTGERPFRAINRHVNPVLGWGWALASLVASMVWCLPQYSMAVGVVRQNLMPGALGVTDMLDERTAKMIVAGAILLLTTLITWAYDSGNWGIRVYELMLKLVVAGIVFCFVGVVFWMSAASDAIHWNEVLHGFIPDFSRLTRPAPGFTPLLEAVPEAYREFWTNTIVAEQRSRLIAAAATAVGINMTFLFPYSLLSKGWTREFRGLAVFDLGTGMLIPFTLATSCVVIASAVQFHPKADVGQYRFFDRAAGLDVDDPQAEAIILEWVATDAGGEKYGQLTDKDRLAMIDALFGKKTKRRDIMLRRLEYKLGPDEFAKVSADKAEVEAQLEPLTVIEARLAGQLEPRDAFQLADSLGPLTGPIVANYVFGLGVLGMTLSTITILMLISGFVICELCGLPSTGWPHRIATLAGAIGVLGPFIWTGDAQFYLAVPASVFGMTLLPIAYVAFLLLMNQRALLGDDAPRGLKRFVWNVLMLVATGVAVFASSVAIVTSKAGMYGVAGACLFLALIAVAHFVGKRRPAAAD